MRLNGRQLGLAAAILCLGALTIGLALLYPALEVGVAYKAKMTCSGVFVAGGQPRAVAEDLESDDLKVLRYVKVHVDAQRQTVTAKALVLLRRHAAYRTTTEGCALVKDVRQATVRRTSPQSSRELPYGNGGTLPELLAVLDSAFAEPHPKRMRRTRAVVVLHRGRVVAERYGPGVDAHTPLPGWSMTKSVVNALAGVLVGAGQLQLDESELFPEWGDGSRARISINDLLQMSSGLEFDEGMSNPRSDILSMLFRSSNMAEFALSKPLNVEPGSRWQYSSGTSNILARVFRDKFPRHAEYLAFPRRALFDPLEMHDAVLETDESGTYVGSSYMYATARQWARFGELYLNGGVWKGQRLLPEGWVEYSTMPAPSNLRRHYGAHFWLDVPEEYRKGADDLPPDAFHAVGHEAQFISVIPSRQLVIVRLGRTRYPEAWDHVDFVRQVMRATDRLGALE